MWILQQRFQKKQPKISSSCAKHLQKSSNHMNITSDYLISLVEIPIRFAFFFIENVCTH